MPSIPVLECCKFLLENKLTIAFAESATAGRLCSEFALAPEAGAFFCGGLVCYDAAVKEHILGMQPELVEKYTPESAEVTEVATKGLVKLFPADIYIGVTGLTAPGGSETNEKPVGTMFIHGVHGTFSFSDRSVFKGNKEDIILQAVDQVALLIMKYINLS